MRSCKGYQYFARHIHVLAQELQTIPITWPFAVWGVDLLGPFKKVTRGLTHPLVVVDKFTKWIKARPLAKIGSKQVVSFVQDTVFCFRVPTLSSPTMTPNSPGRSS
jgi:hypothetical protein